MVCLPSDSTCGLFLIDKSQESQQQFQLRQAVSSQTYEEEKIQQATHTWATRSMANSYVLKLLGMERYYKEERGGALPEWKGRRRLLEEKRVSELFSGLPRTGVVDSHKLWCRPGDG